MRSSPQAALNDESRSESAARAAHAVLREDTRDAHAAAEAMPAMTALLDGSLTCARYARFLRALAGVFEDWERAQRRFLGDLARRRIWRYDSRLRRLEADLASLDKPGARLSLPRIEPCGVADPDSAWGMLYVVEGAALGGHVLARRLRSAWPEGAAVAYLDGGHGPGATWPRFQRVLDQHLRDPAAIERAVGGARRMFDRYATALQAV